MLAHSEHNIKAWKLSHKKIQTTSLQLDLCQSEKYRLCCQEMFQSLAIPADPSALRSDVKRTHQDTYFARDPLRSYFDELC